MKSTRLCRFGLAIPVLLVGPALAAPNLQITAPVDGDCVNSGQPTIEGTVGGEPLAAETEVALAVQVQSAVDGEAQLTVLVDGAEVSVTAEFLFADTPTELELLVPGDVVEDGADRRIEVRVEAADGAASDAVTIDLDRRAPDVLFDEATLGLLGMCFEDPPPLDYQVVDALDPDPVVETDVEIVEDGCTVRQIITVRDHCAGGGVEGNSQMLRFATVRHTDQQPAVVFEGIREEERLLEGALSYSLGVPDDCIVSRDASYVRGDDPPRPFGEGEFFDRAGDYVASVSADVCGQAPVQGERRFTVVPAPRVDAGGPYLTQQGAELILSAAGSELPLDVIGPVTEYAWDAPVDGFFDLEEGRAEQVPFDTDRPDGEYPIGLRIRTESGFEGFDFTTVTIRDVIPTCDAGGPYAAAQGEVIRFDASASAPGVAEEPIVAYAWDFGDGEGRRSAGPETTHDYLEEGQYEVVLVVEDEDSPSDPCIAQVIVGDVDPVVAGVAALDEAIEGLPVRFTAGQTSAGSAAEPLIGYRWDFGDGEQAEGPALRGPEHTFLDDGQYRVCLQASDVDSSDEACIDVEVADLRPTARCSGPGFAIEGREVVFDARGSRAGGAADPVARYTWDFGDGSDPVIVDDPATTTVAHAFARDGELTVTLTVADEDSSVQATCAIVIDDASPQAGFTVDTGIAGAFEGDVIDLDASGSRPGSAGDIITEYHWLLGDGTEIRGPDRVAIQHAWPDEGEYTVELRVTDIDGSVAVARNFVTVLNRAPQNVRIIGPERVEVGQTNAWRVEFDDVEADLPIINWRLGDGAVVEGRAGVEHIYGEVPRIGRVTMRVSVDDQDGGVTGAEMQVEITAAGPTVEGPQLVEGVENQPIEAEFLLLSAPGNGGPDGPLDVQIPTRPVGSAVEIVPGNPIAERQVVRFAWTPGSDDAGDHRLLIVATAPSGLERVWPVVVRVADDRGAWLAATGGDLGTGRVSLYRFDRRPGLDVSSFDLAGEVVVTGGARTPTIDAAGRLHVTSPGSNAVVVITLDDPPRLGRRLPLPGPPTGLADALGQRWTTIDGWGEQALCAYDPTTLKRTGCWALDDARPVALATVADAGGPGEPLLVAGDARGDLLVLDPERALDDRDPIVARHDLDVAPGLDGDLRRIVQGDGRLLVLDPVGRQIIELDPTGLLGETGTLIVDRWPVPFSPVEATIRDGVLWFTSSRGLERLTPAGEAEVVDDGAAIGVAVLPESLYGRAALSIGSRDRVSTRALDGAALDTARGGGGRQLLFFETPVR